MVRTHMVKESVIPIRFSKGCFRTPAANVEGALTRSELATVIRVVRRQLGIQLTSTHHPKISWPTLKQLAVEVASDDYAIRHAAESALRRRGFRVAIVRRPRSTSDRGK